MGPSSSTYQPRADILYWTGRAVAQDHAKWHSLCDSAQPAVNATYLVALTTGIPLVGMLPTALTAPSRRRHVALKTAAVCYGAVTAPRRRPAPGSPQYLQASQTA
eukprot:365188-Chlamydomonas_euryale.AAC.14